ncbi:diaminopimelate epimerase [Chondromyces apiculatus]|uniref:Diaminopimelate epimerase n=1 Tax=Chondromyces apiculatus DSM 436 TaxID=1192034 RepID=A0A017T4X5_9BACT|nr:diaminopimelate epimerase [Chondromyces apiculatus]EYF03596.1 Diaminopimelate epimerase [Chondromyces apiculatus DSM 436]
MSGKAWPFEKWEGLGNDFIVVEGLPMSVELARTLCDRRFGIGADGVLVVRVDPEAAPRMQVWNADGSRPEMCGNGLRCVAAWLVDHGRVATGDGLRIQTDAGERRCDIVAAGPDLYQVTVDMGRARLTGPLVIPAEGAKGAEVQEHRFTCVDMGNPHAVTFAPHPPKAIDTLAPRVATLPPEGTNVELCRMTGPRRIEVLVWERGVGRTLACGTGACAVAAVACDQGLTPYGEPLDVVLPGGALTIQVAAGTRALTMRGPARRVFVGEVVTA